MSPDNFWQGSDEDVQMGPIDERQPASADHHYYRGRAEDELAAAETAAHPGAAKAHYLLAGLYLNRAYNSGPENGA